MSAKGTCTIGRLPDNDVVVPFDVVSGHHARLERRGGRVFLIDLESRNGTSLNDPLNKIRCAEVTSRDIIFLGTHPVSAVELLAAVPADTEHLAADVRSTPSAKAGRKPQSEGTPAAECGSAVASGHALPATETAALGSKLLAGKWAVRMGIGTAAAVLVLVAARLFVATPGEPVAATNGEQQPRQTLTAVVAVQPPRAEPAASPPPSVPVTSVFDEQLVRKSQEGVYLVCFRTERVIVFTRSTAWAISPDTIVCPSSMLEQIEKARNKSGSGDECGVVCNPSRTLRIMTHAPCGGDGGFLSIGRLEAPAESVSVARQAAPAFEPVPGQKLAVIVASGPSSGGQADDPKTIVRRLVTLTVDQVQRDAQQSPLRLYCTPAEDVGPAVAAPVFDGTGCVVGCVEWAKKTELRVVPLRRLTTLFQTIPSTSEVSR